MRKLFVTLLFLVMPVIGNCAEFMGIHLLEPGDPIWYSEDGATWHKGEFYSFGYKPDCEIIAESVDDFGDDYKHFFCEEDDGYVVTANYYHAENHPDELVINYLTAFDPDKADPTKAELYGLLTRIENLISRRDPRSAFNTASNLMEDRIDMQRRITAIREILKNE